MFEALKATIERIEHEDYESTPNGEALWKHDLQTAKDQIQVIEDVFDNNEQVLDELTIVIKERENKYS